MTKVEKAPKLVGKAMFCKDDNGDIVCAEDAYFLDSLLSEEKDSDVSFDKYFLYLLVNGSVMSDKNLLFIQLLGIDRSSSNHEACADFFLDQKGEIIADKRRSGEELFAKFANEWGLDPAFFAEFLKQLVDTTSQTNSK